MNEYTVEVLSVLVLLVFLDWATGILLFRRGRFYVLLAALSVGTFIFDGYLNGRPVLEYGWRYLSGIQLWVVPLEDFGYGVALATVAILTWEMAGRAGKRRR